MKKIKYLLLLMIFVIAGCSEKDTLENLQIIQNNYTIAIGENLYLSTNANLLNIEEINWKSSNDFVATVEDGIVTGNNVGAVIITATSKEYRATVRVIVEDRTKPMIVIDGKQSVKVGQSITLNIMKSKKVSSTQVTWSSNDENIATVIEGVVTGVNSGIVKIVAEMNNDPSIYGEYIILVQDESSIEDQLKNIINRDSYEFADDFDLTVFSEHITASIEKIGNAFVGVSNYKYINGKLNLQSIGSGIIFDKVEVNGTFKYKLLSNQHVIDNYSQVKVYLGYVGVEIIGEVKKFDKDLDLAIIEFETDLDIEPVNFSNKPLRNEFVFAIGNPTGYEYFGSVTFGIVSNPERYIKADDNGTKQKYIQHDAAINSGNSGGPLLNIDGELVGINTLKLVQLSVEGMGFAIPIDVIVNFIN